MLLLGILHMELDLLLEALQIITLLTPSTLKQSLYPKYLATIISQWFSFPDQNEIDTPDPLLMWLFLPSLMGESTSNYSDLYSTPLEKQLGLPHT